RAGARGLAPHVAPFAGDHVAVARAVERVGPALTLVAADPDPPHLIAEPAQVIGPAVVAVPASAQLGRRLALHHRLLVGSGDQQWRQSKQNADGSDQDSHLDGATPKKGDSL